MTPTSGISVCAALWRWKRAIRPNTHTQAFTHKEAFQANIFPDPLRCHKSLPLHSHGMVRFTRLLLLTKLRITRCLSTTQLFPQPLLGAAPLRTAGGPRKQETRFVWHRYLDFSSAFNSRLANLVMAFLGDYYYFIPARSEGRKREKITYLVIVLLLMSAQSPPPELCACGVNHAGNSHSSLRFWALWCTYGLPWGLLHFNYVPSSTYSTQSS